MGQSRLPAFVVAASVLMVGCIDHEPGTSPDYAIETIDTTMLSRGVAVPVTLVRPVVGGGRRYPLVIMAHGHGGSRQEAGAFPAVADGLAKRGIATIRIDFPGCGDSSESFAENNLSNMLADLRAARDFAQATADVDESRIGLFGYSMGGRLAALLSEIDPRYTVMALWAPAVASGATREKAEFGGQENYDMLKQTARDTGAVEYMTRWGTRLLLGYRWFEDMEQSRPLDALAKFSGPILVLYGDADDVVPPPIAKAALSAATRSGDVVEVVIPTAQHGLGFYTERPEIAARVVEVTVDFLGSRL